MYLNNVGIWKISFVSMAQIFSSPVGEETSSLPGFLSSVILFDLIQHMAGNKEIKSNCQGWGYSERK